MRDNEESLMHQLPLGYVILETERKNTRSNCVGFVWSVKKQMVDIYTKTQMFKM